MATYATIINKKNIVVQKTCAFDSIFQIVASGMGIRNVYKTDMTALIISNDFIKLSIDILTRGKIVLLSMITSHEH